eukprot:204257-Pyramimonas_sp.AAC.1
MPWICVLVVPRHELWRLGSDVALLRSLLSMLLLCPLPFGSLRFAGPAPSVFCLRFGACASKRSSVPKWLAGATAGQVRPAANSQGPPSSLQI